MAAAVPPRPPSGRTPTSAPCPPLPPKAMTGSSIRSSWSRGCARSAACWASPGSPRPSAETCSRCGWFSPTRGTPDWVPAVEQRGEGIFLRAARGRRRALGRQGRRSSPPGRPRRRLPPVGAHNRVRPPPALGRPSPVSDHPHPQPHADPPGRPRMRRLLRQPPRARLHRNAPYPDGRGAAIHRSQDSEGTLGGLVALRHARTWSASSTRHSTTRCTALPIRCAPNMSPSTPPPRCTQPHVTPACSPPRPAAKPTTAGSTGLLLADLTGDGLAFTP